MADSRRPYLRGYPQTLCDQIEMALQKGQLQAVMERRYRGTSVVKTDKQLRQYVLDLKATFLKRSAPISKICFDDRIETLNEALGLHTFASRIQGPRMKTKSELRVASLFRELPEPFLRMVVVHELSHLKEKEHNKAFYQMCCHMEPDYHQLELDLRLFLTVREDRAGSHLGI